MRVDFRLDGRRVAAEVPYDTMLLDVVRDLGVTAPKEGCGVGVCGTCSLVVDDRLVSGCITLAATVEGADVWSAAGLVETDPQLGTAFVRHEGMQCGICTPGQVACAAAARRQVSGAGLDELRHFVSGNLCRCTGYQTIMEAVREYVGDR